MKTNLVYNGEPIPLSVGDYALGRGQHESLCIAGPGFEESGRIIGNPDLNISRMQSDSQTHQITRAHFYLTVAEASVTLKDSQSTHGTFLDKTKITEETISAPGKHTINLGSSSLDLVLTE
jgi:pSer/pThr/pTyr-binding forkhead associated (FHA) protein